VSYEHLNVANLILTLLRYRTFTLGLAIIVFIGIIAALADTIAPYSPTEFVAGGLEPPSPKHIFGTDDMGRDLFSMTVYGARVSLVVGLLAALLSTVIGTSIGVLCGVVRGFVDAVVMRIIDFMLSLPYLAVALAIVAFLKPSIWIIIVIIAALSWITTAKVVRTHTMSVMGNAFVEAARAVGAGTGRIITRYVLPNVSPMILSSMALNVRGAILFEAALSFLGLGDPSQVSWGTILFYARRAGAFVLGAWWYIVPPGLMIMLTVLGFTLIATGLDEVLNPRLRTT